MVAPSSGHVKTKEPYDAMANVVYTMTENHREMFDQFAAVSIRGVATSRPVSDPGMAQAFSRAGAAGLDDEWCPHLAAKRMNPNRRPHG